MIDVTVIGCGTSTGVPMVGCRCVVCTSDDPRNRRWRAGLWIRLAGRSVLVDTPTDLRAQALRFGIDAVDAVLFTHAHADHLFGLDELRVLARSAADPVPCYGSAATLRNVRRSFGYAFDPGQAGGGRPRLDLVAVRDPFDLFGVELVPIPVWHGRLEVLGFRIGSFAYVTDCNRIPAESLARLRGVEILILDALKGTRHPTHFSIPEAIAMASEIGAGRTYLTHLSHEVDAATPSRPLPEGVRFAHDGLRITLD